MYSSRQQPVLLKHTPRHFSTGVFVLSVVVFAFIGIGTSFAPRKAAAATASTINFQARLLSSSGNIVPDGTYNIEFKVYDSLSSGASAQGVCSLDSSTDDCWWLETRTGGNKVTVKNGYLSVSLGSVTAFGSSINWNQDLWITMNIGGTGAPSWDGEMSPRMKLASVPYAQSATKLNVESGGNTGLLQFASLTGNRTITAPDQTGTILLDTVLTTEGDIYYRNATSVTRLARGGNGECLTSNATTILWGGCGSGVSVIGALDGGTAGANGASISGSNLYMQSASATYPGLVNTTTQTFAGLKTFNSGITLAANQTLNVTGGTTGSRPGSPTEGMVYFDTDTSQLLIYEETYPASGTFKWKSARAGSTRIVASSTSAQTSRDAADYVTNGEDSSGSGIGTLDGDQIEINLALQDAKTMGGGTVYLMEGTYTIDGAIVVPNNVTLAGAGANTYIRLGNFGATSTSINMITNEDTTTGTRIAIRDLRLDGRDSINTSGTQNGIFLDNMGAGTGASARDGAKITGVVVRDMKNYGIRIDTSYNNTVSGSTFQGNTSTGIYSFSASNTVITGNITQGNGGNGMYIWGGSNNTTTGNSAQGNTGYGIAYYQSDNGVITGNVTQGNTDAGMYLGSLNYATVTGNTIQGNTQEGILMNVAANYSTISGNTIATNAGGGIVLAPGSYNVISGNKLHNNGGANTNDAIKLSTAASYNSIIGNDITDTSCITNCYGILLSNTGGAPVGNYIADNRMAGPSAQYPATISDNGSATRFGSQMTPAQLVQSSSSLIRANGTSVISGSVDPTASASVTGVNTYFTTELQVGDRITVSGETRTITAIASNTSLTVAAPFSDNANDTSVDRLPAALVVADSTGAAKVTVGDDGSLNVGSGTMTVGTASTAGQITVTDGSNNGVTISVNALAGNYTLAIPTLTANDTFCLQGVANCSGAGASSVGALDGGTPNANGATISSNVLYLQSASASYAGLVSTAAQTFAGDKTFNGNILAGGSATGTTATTSGTGTNTTTLTFTGTTSFANNDIIFIDNAGQDYYTRIVSGANAASVTVSPAITFENSRTVTKYTAQNIGATATDYTTQTNRFFQGYFTGGVVTGAGSTIYSDGNISAGPGLTVKNPSDTTNAFQVQNTSGRSLFNADTANMAISLGERDIANGYTTVFGTSNTGGYNGMQAVKFTASASGTMTAIRVYFRDTDGSPNDQFEVALYADGAACGILSSCPGTKIAESSSATVTDWGWAEAAISASVTSGTSYWLAVNNNGTTTNDTAYASGTGADSYVFVSQAFGTWPSPFTAPSFTANTKISMYAKIASTGTKAFVTNSSGNIAIGAAAPDSSYQLLVDGANNGNAALRLLGKQDIAVDNMYALSVTNTAETFHPLVVDTVNNRLNINVDPTYAWADAALNVLQTAGTANILRLSNNGSVTQLTVTSAGDVKLGNDTDKTLYVDQSDSGAGHDLTVAAGQGATGQVGGDLLLTAGANGTASGTPGSVIIKANGGNSATMLQVQNSTGGNILTVDTINSRTGINTAAPDSTLHVVSNNTVTTSSNQLFVQSGTGDNAIQLQSPSKSFSLGLDASDYNKFKLSSSTASASNATVGNTNIEATNNTGQSGVMYASKFATGGSGGTLTSISAYYGAISAGTQVSYAIYEGTSTAPTNLLGNSASTVINATGWLTLPVSATLSASTTYWLVVNSNSNSNGVRYDSGAAANSGWWKAQAFGSWPASAGAGTADTGKMSIYGTYTVTGAYDLFTKTLLEIGDTGQAIFRNSTNSITAFQVQNAASSTTVLNVDTANNRVGVGTAVPTASLHVATGNMIIDGAYTGNTPKLSIGGTIVDSDTTSNYAFHNQVYFQKATNVTHLYGLNNIPILQTGAGNVSNAYGALSRVETRSGYTGKITNAYGYYADQPYFQDDAANQRIDQYNNFYAQMPTAIFQTKVGNSGNTTGTIYNSGLKVGTGTAQAGSGGTLNNMSLNVELSSGNTTGTNNYGLYLTGNGGVSATSNYAIYSNSTANSYLAGKLGISNASPANKLNINTPYTAVASTDVVITATDANTIPLVLQVAATPTVNAFQVQSSAGAVQSGFTASGRLFVNTTAAITGVSITSATGTNTTVGQVIQGAASQSADLFQLRDNNGLINASFNGAGNQLTLGRIAASGTVTQGKLLFSDGTTDNYSATLQSATLTGNQILTLPNLTGTLCVKGGSNACSASAYTKIVAASNSPQAIKDVADYVADGTADQTEINSALTAAAGGTVYLAEGTYTASATITIPNNTTLAGAGVGTVIQLADLDATENLIENTDTTAGTGVVIRDLKIDGRSDLNTAGTQHGIYMLAMGGAVTDITRKGATVENVTITRFRNDGIQLDTSGQSHISQVYALSNGNYGIYLTASHRTTIANSLSQANTSSNIRLNSGSTSNTITGNTLRDSTNSSGIRIDGSSHYNTVTGNSSASNSSGISLSNSNYITITGNTSTDEDLYGIWLAGSNYNVISSNTVSNSGSATTNNGIYVDDSDYNSFIGNVITDDQCDTTCYAINIFNTSTNSDGNYLANNRISDTDATYDDNATVRDAGTNTSFGNQMSAAQILQSSSSYISANGTTVITGSIDPAASTSVTGVSTIFTKELQVGDKITVTGETRTITAIASDTSLTVDTAFSNNANDTSVDRLPAALVVQGSHNALAVLGATGTRLFTVDTTNQRVDVSSSFLRVTGTLTSNVALQLNGSNLTVRSTTSSSQYGIQNQPGFDLSTVTGGVLTDLYGMINIADIKVAPSDRINNVYGEYVRVDNTAGATIDTQYGLYVAASSSSGITTKYGIYVGSQTNGGTNYLMSLNGASASLTVTNAGLFNSTSNSTTGFVVQKNAGGAVLTVDTANSDVSIDANAQYGQRLCHSGADGAAQNDVALGDCLTGGADHAEMYEVIGTAEPGDVVASKGQYSVGVTNAMYQADALGVISTNPVTDGILGMQNTNKATRQPVGLAGRVPVKLSLENGPIQIGDYLTASSTPGFAMKATGSGRVIGIALEAFDYSSPRVSGLVAAEEVARDVAHAGELPSYRSNPALWPANTGKIMMFVNPTFYSAPINSVLQGTDAVLTENAIIGGSIAAGGDLNVSGATTLSTLTVTGQAVFKAKLYVAEVETGTITINGHIITSGTAPAVAVGQAAGAADGASGIVGPSAIIEGNDTSGTITLVTGVNTAADELVRVMFNSGFSDRPRVIISATNKQTARLGAYTDAGATTPEHFSIFANVQPEPTTEYKFTYFVVQ